ncbi:MAG: TRAP transporter small permease [Burkholderiales bacterium]|nr:TRAP transporter small permease [Burkholderiales bacterium]
MKRLEQVAATLFGAVFLILSFAVALETFMRKVFNVSLQGVDELGGYILAVGASLAFTLALISRAHIRIDLVHDRLARAPRLALNVIAVLFITATAAFMLAMAYYSLRDSIALNSTAQTPWATPIKYPQMVWIACLGLFAAVSAGYGLRVLLLAASGRSAEIEARYSPKGAKEELQEELDDVRARGAAGGSAP